MQIFVTPEILPNMTVTDGFYFSFYNLAMFIDGKAHNMPKVSKLCTEEVYNLHISAFKYSMTDLHKSAPPLKSC